MSLYVTFSDHQKVKDYALLKENAPVLHDYPIVFGAFSKRLNPPTYAEGKIDDFKDVLWDYHFDYKRRWEWDNKRAFPKIVVTIVKNNKGLAIPSSEVDHGGLDQYYWSSVDVFDTFELTVDQAIVPNFRSLVESHAIPLTDTDPPILLLGLDVPDPLIGRVGDYFFFTSHLLLYGPKTTNWGAGSATTIDAVLALLQTEAFLKYKNPRSQIHSGLEYAAFSGNPLYLIAPNAKARSVWSPVYDSPFPVGGIYRELAFVRANDYRTYVGSLGYSIGVATYTVNAIPSYSLVIYLTDTRFPVGGKNEYYGVGGNQSFSNLFGEDGWTNLKNPVPINSGSGDYHFDPARLYHSDYPHIVTVSSPVWRDVVPTVPVTFFLQSYGYTVSANFST